jgi:hypothetical protein
VKFIASHFYKLDSSELKRLEVESLKEILSSEDLCLRSEDDLVEFISSLGESFSSLYDYVELKYLSPKGVENFLSSFSLENINARCWESICGRLRMNICNVDLRNKRFCDPLTFRYVKGGEWDGIINYLTKECCGNVHEKGIVNITSSGDHCNECWRVTDYEWKDRWFSTSTANSWICFDFKDKCVSLQNYTLKSKCTERWYFIEWQIEGSNNGETWTILDNRNTRELCGQSIVKTYECSKVTPNEFFHLIRMKQTGKSSSGDNYFGLSGIEFFGIMKTH